MSYPRKSRLARQVSPRRSQVNAQRFRLRLLICCGVLILSAISFYGKGQINPVTGKTQRVDMTIEEEIRLGLQSVSSMGLLSTNRQATAHVERIGNQLVARLNESNKAANRTIPYPFQFHLLDAPQTVNAFALPGGQIFVTTGLYRQLEHNRYMSNTQQDFDGRLAGVLGHEIGHVIERHAAQRLAKSNFIQGVFSGLEVFDETRTNRINSQSRGTKMAADAADWFIGLQYSRADELASDGWGVKLMALTGYDPTHMIEVIDILESSATGSQPIEFLSTHPRPPNRRQYIENLILENSQNGTRSGLR
ncbi:M48 family metalloprotease [bacterium]|jgi:beta-barrel assembly-enhancing protease|nr:M48 family metalloprotease [bacterium]MDB2526131.1 M48 family metalloprotease [Mariniblastus sp.]